MTDPAQLVIGSLFGDTEPVGTYVWQAGFLTNGEYTYDSTRGEFRQQRETSASGIEVAEFGFEADGTVIGSSTSNQRSTDSEKPEQSGRATRPLAGWIALCGM
jgi:hypothetical protein